VSRGYLFIGHGTRWAPGVIEFQQFVEVVACRIKAHWKRLERPGDFIFESCFLELVQPDIEAGVYALVRSGITEIIVVPLFLFEAAHMKEDIPQALTKVQRRWSHLEFYMLPSVGVNEAFIHVATARIEQAGWHLAQPSSVVMVGRGSRDVKVLEDFHCVSRKVSTKLGLHRDMMHVCFIAGMGQSLERALIEATQQGQQTIYVMPYLWFDGRLNQALAEKMNTWRKQYDLANEFTGKSPIHIHVCAHLGLHPDLTRDVARVLF